MSARVGVVLEIRPQDSSQTRLVEDDDMIQTFSPYRSDEPLGVGVLPGRARSTKHFLDAEPGGRLAEGASVRAIAIAQQETRATVPGKGLHELLRCPLCRGMKGDRKVDWPTTVMGEDYE